MRALPWTILFIGAILAAAPARAQTYDPRYPVCLQVYAPRGGYIECLYTSLAQCNATASGRAAQCYVNPFFGYGQEPGWAWQRHRRDLY